MNRCSLGLLIAVALAWTGAAGNAFSAEGGPFPGTRSAWNGYERYDFVVHGRDCCVLLPQLEAPGRPWIWRARFFGHEPQTDLALLSRGFHLVYMDVAGLFGCPQAVAHWDQFYAFLTEKHGFAPKVALEGMSRGGLIVFNWAAANPEKVACIYADAPVCDIKSWPAGRGVGDGNPPEWEACLKAYGFTEEQALAYDRNPIDQLAPLAAAKIPLLHVCGAADTGVPVSENTAIVEERYKALGGPITVILKEGVGHHPHSLKDPTPIVDFILEHTVGKERYFELRGGFENARIRFEREKEGRVVFLGGSITEMKGWRDLMCDYLQRRFPDTAFDFVNAGIASTDSTLGAFRLQTDVFGRGRVDLLFVEYAVNDQHNSRTTADRIRGMEGIIRQARRLQPEIDILVQYFVDPRKIELFNSGQPSPVIVAHERVCRHYDIPVHDLARAVTDRINRGEFTWKQFGGLHPAPFGHEVYAKSMGRLFDAAWAKPLADDATVEAPWVPVFPLDRLNYQRGRYVSIEAAELGGGWKRVASWDKDDGAGKRKQFVHIPMLEATEPGAVLTLKFRGTAVGILVTAGPDVGVLEYTIDGGEARRVEQFTQWSEGLHIPWAYMLDAELSRGAHTLELRTTDQKNEKSKGYAVRLVQFLVN